MLRAQLNKIVEYIHTDWIETWIEDWLCTVHCFQGYGEKLQHQKEW